MPRRPDWRRIKVHRNYEIGEAADLLGVHENTVRNWIKNEGLPALTDRRPYLIVGRFLRDFLAAKYRKHKRPLKDGEIRCGKCRLPKRPADGMADFIVYGNNNGALRGICPDCHTLMHRFASRTSLDKIAAGLDLQFTEAEKTLDGLSDPPVNCDLERSSETHENPQS